MWFAMKIDDDEEEERRLNDMTTTKKEKNDDDKDNERSSQPSSSQQFGLPKLILYSASAFPSGCYAMLRFGVPELML